MTASFLNKHDTTDVFLQPQLTRYHHPNRGIMDSEKLNLHAAQIRYDLMKLYGKVDVLDTKIDAVFKDIGNTSATSELQSWDYMPGKKLIEKEAVFYIDAVNSVDGEQTAVNKGWGGSALNAQYGGSTGVDSSDPKLLTWTGQNYIYSSGGTGNLVSHSRTALATSIATFEFAVRVTFDNFVGVNYWAGWNSGYAQADISATTKQIQMTLYTAGVQPIGGGTSTIGVPGLNAGMKVWLKGIITISTANCQYYYSYDDTNSYDLVNWIQVGTDVAGLGAGLTPALSRSSDLYFCSPGAGVAPMTGNLYVGIEKINGVKVTELDTSMVISSSDTTVLAKTGQLFNIIRSTTGRKNAVVTRPVWLMGSDDALIVVDNDLLDFTKDQAFTYLVITQTVGNWPSSAQNIFTKGGYGVTPNSIYLGSNTTGYVNYFAAATNATYYYGNNSGSLNTLNANVFVRAASTLTTYSNNTVINPGATNSTTDFNADVSNVNNVMIGAGQSWNYFDGEVYAAAIFRRALTAAEVAQVTAYLNINRTQTYLPNPIPDVPTITQSLERLSNRLKVLEKVY